jgi:phage baseplate assembly protein W
MLPRRQYRINTLDVDKNRGIGIAIPFDPVNIFKITYTTKDQIKSNLLNFLLTNKGERVFNPNFGADIRSLVFDQMVNLEETRESITDSISLYFPELDLTELSFTPNYDTNTLFIKISYIINTEADSISIQIQ